jgi:glucose-1-phosphate cytidylyltransferase
VNGGFFVLEPGVLDYIEADDTHWEGEPMENLSQGGQMHAFQHRGYWQSMDTLRDVRALNEAWDSGKARWKTW